MRKYFLLTLFIISFLFIFSNFISAQENTNIPQAPQTINEAKTLGWKILTGFPEALKGIWQGSLEIWKSMFRWIRNFWNTYIEPHIINIWNKIKSFFKKEVEIKKPEVKQELEKEKQEMKVEIPKAGKSIWERFKEIIKWWKD